MESNTMGVQKQPSAEGVLERDYEDTDSENGIPIYSSLENLLLIPPSLSQELSEAAMKAQGYLEKWSNNRRAMVRKMDKIASDLDSWDRGCAISTAVGSGVGVASGFAAIGGLIFMPPVAIAGFIVGTVAGASNVITGVSKWSHFKSAAMELNAMVENDKMLFKELMQSREELFSVIKKVIDEEEQNQKFDGIDVGNNIKSILGGSVFGATGCATRFAIGQMGRLSSSLVKGVLHGAAAIGIIMDAVTLAMSAKELSDGKPSDFAEQVRAAAHQYEIHRMKVNRGFLNQDIWNDNEEADANRDDELMEFGEDSSDIGSFVRMSQSSTPVNF
ncbi:unnamed protein product [Caenorhabditis bovis]|uniref:Uncharacterized protein n=1 Tax=Caenorhabditis bovis TaxID=2654633 RepID=A0A8S1EUK1_9PELO|nr:unnamed protein product [Caenorhabditis bovis]